jgi:hypothetical protein
MMVALEGVPYRLDLEPRVAKPVIESKHQLLGMPADLPLHISWELQTRGIDYVYVRLECSRDHPEGPLV